MLFSSVPFLFYFLPVVLALYFLVPRVLKNGVLLIASLVFYAWGEPKYVFLMAATILLFYLCGLAMGKCQNTGWKKFWLTLSVVVSLGLLAVFKYADFFVGNFNAATGLRIPLLKLALPIGISFYTFQCLSYTVDVYRGNARVQKNIVRYVDISRELDNRTHSWEDFHHGLRRFLVGLGKKVLIADQFALLTQLFRQSQGQSVLFYWMYAVAFTLNIYFDFSGYSDMAIGLGRILGFRFLENFNYPYLSGSVTEFWRRWHISLGSWFRDYVYIPMGGNRVGKGRWVFNILTVWMLTGLWHGAAWNFVLWGLLFAVLLLLEKWVPGLKKLPGLLRHGYVLLMVVFSFVLFNAESLSQAGADFAGLLGLGGLPGTSAEPMYYLKSYAPLFVAGILGATPLVKKIGQWLGTTRWGGVLELTLMLGLLLVCSAYLVDGSFSPFLYFRF